MYDIVKVHETIIMIDIIISLIQLGVSDPKQLSNSLVVITNRSEEIQAVDITIATTLTEKLTEEAIENEEVIYIMRSAVLQHINCKLYFTCCRSGTTI